MKTNEKIQRLKRAHNGLEKVIVLMTEIKEDINGMGNDMPSMSDEAFDSASDLHDEIARELKFLIKEKIKKESQPIWNIADGAGGLVCSGLTYYDAVARYETHLESDPTNSQEWEIFCGDEECEK